MPSYGSPSGGFLSGLTRQAGAIYKVAQNGLATYDVTYRGVLTDSLTVMQGDAPEEGYPVVLLSFSIRREDACDGHDDPVVAVDLHYEGHDTTHTNDAVAESMQLSITSSQEPVETHPDFLEFAGYPGNELNGAKFFASGDNAGQFNFFKHNFDNATQTESNTILNTFAGVRSYLYPTQVLTVDRIEDDWPEDIEVVGKIVDENFISMNPVPFLASPRDWLYAGMNVRNIANVYWDTTRTYQASGPRGWVQQIYSQAPTFP